MQIKDFQHLLDETKANTNLLRRTIEGEIKKGLVMDEESFKKFRDDLLEASTDLAMAEVQWGYGARLSPSSKKFLLAKVD